MGELTTIDRDELAELQAELAAANVRVAELERQNDHLRAMYDMANGFLAEIDAEVGPEPEEPREGAGEMAMRQYESDIFVHYKHRAEQLAAKVVALQSWQESTAGDLLKYGRHEPMCESFRNSPIDCDCGYRNALSRSTTQPLAEKQS